MAVEKDFELLDDYLTNRLSGREKEAFEQKMKNDPTLNSEFQLQQKLIESIKQTRIADLKVMLNNTVVPPAYGGQAALLTKITAWLVVTGVMSAGVYFFLHQTEKAEKAETNEQPVVDKKILEEPAKITTQQAVEPNVQPIDKKTELISVKKPVIKHEKTNSKNVDKSNQATAVTTKTESIDRQKPDVFDPTNEVESSTTHENDAIKAKTGDIEVVASSIEVETDNTSKKYTFHYQFKDKKLFLYGSFEQNLYEIMEFFTGDKRTVFLYYKDSYYLLNEENEKIKPLTPINDPVLQQKLKEFRDKN